MEHLSKLEDALLSDLIAGSLPFAERQKFNLRKMIDTVQIFCYVLTKENFLKINTKPRGKIGIEKYISRGKF